MFDAPMYLTGKDDKGFVKTGDIFWLHNARIEGTVTINNETRPQAKLKVSHTKDGETSIVFSAGVGIVGQVSRMDDDDRRAMPMEVRLDAIPSKVAGRNSTHVITPANQPEPMSAEGTEEIPF
jgi:hypothetical protein